MFLGVGLDKGLLGGTFTSYTGTNVLGGRQEQMTAQGYSPLAEGAQEETEGGAGWIPPTLHWILSHSCLPEARIEHSQDEAPHMGTRAGLEASCCTSSAASSPCSLVAPERYPGLSRPWPGCAGLC